MTTLIRLRHAAEMSQRDLAEAVDYDRTYISKVEAGTQRPSVTFAERADAALAAGGQLVAARARVEAPPRRRPADPAGALLVLRDEATLRYDGSRYFPVQRRLLRNDGPDPVTRYLVRISVDRWPGDPERSAVLYRERPLAWESLELWARHGDDGTPMRWEPKEDRDATKEAWVRFEGKDGRRLTLYPGQEAWIEYGYGVSDEQWGNWYQRAVRHPTRHLSVRLEFPRSLLSSVWGLETAPTADARTLPTPIAHSVEGDLDVWSWSVEEPPLQARYRLEWDFARPPQTASDAKPSQVMAGLGIIQEGDPILSEVAKPFDLPAEAEACRRVVAELHSVMERVRGAHAFSGGMGIAAPQVGISRAVALVRTPEGEVLSLINPRVLEESEATVEAYEGCLSFFDVRGKAVRPATLVVEQQDVDGTERIVSYDGAVAGLVGHEVDHLHGRLYRERMRPGVEPISVSEYRRR